MHNKQMHQFFLSGIQSKKSKDQKPHLPLSFFLYFFLLQIFLIFIMDSPNSFRRVPLHKECKHLLPKEEDVPKHARRTRTRRHEPKTQTCTMHPQTGFIFFKDTPTNFSPDPYLTLPHSSRFRRFCHFPSKSRFSSLSLNTHTLSHSRHTLKTFRDSQVSFSLQHSQNCQKRL